MPLGQQLLCSGREIGVESLALEFRGDFNCHFFTQTFFSAARSVDTAPGFPRVSSKYYHEAILGMPVHPGAWARPWGCPGCFLNRGHVSLVKRVPVPQLLHVSHPFFLGDVCCSCSVHLFLLGRSHLSGWAGFFSFLGSVHAVFHLMEFELCIWRDKTSVW